MSVKATIRENGMIVKVHHMGYMSYHITVNNVAIECYPNFGKAIARANAIARLGPEELELRSAYAPASE